MIPFSVTCTGAGTASVDIASVSDTLARRRKKVLTLWRERGDERDRDKEVKFDSFLRNDPSFQSPKSPRLISECDYFFFPCMLHSIARRFSKK